MVLRVELEDVSEVKVLLRAGIELKFDLAGDANALVGSPIYASVLNRLRDLMIEEVCSKSSSHPAQELADWYRLSLHEQRCEIVARRVPLHPRWRKLNTVELREWVETLAAPLVVDDEGLAAVYLTISGMSEVE